MFALYGSEEQALMRGIELREVMWESTRRWNRLVDAGVRLVTFCMLMAMTGSPAYAVVDDTKLSQLETQATDAQTANDLLMDDIMVLSQKLMEHQLPLWCHDNWYDAWASWDAAQTRIDIANNDIQLAWMAFAEGDDYDLGVIKGNLVQACSKTWTGSDACMGVFIYGHENDLWEDVMASDYYYGVWMTASQWAIEVNNVLNGITAPWNQ